MLKRYLLQGGRQFAQFQTGRTATMTAMPSRFFSVKVGDSMPAVKVSHVTFDGADKNYHSEIVEASDLFKGKKVVVVGLVGAFTPIC